MQRNLPTAQAGFQVGQVLACRTLCDTDPQPGKLYLIESTDGTAMLRRVVRVDSERLFRSVVVGVAL